jgi:hypothetical protein
MKKAYQFMRWRGNRKEKPSREIWGPDRIYVYAEGVEGRKWFQRLSSGLCKA